MSDVLESFERALAERVGPLLSDGTAFRDLFDLERREVSMRVLVDPELYQLELRRIFARAWIAIAHVSEIPEPGDFVLRNIGLDQVIVTRTRTGEVSILLNVCAHRGMELCWADKGSSRSFRCPYHGWVYDGDGRLMGAPFEREMYGADWDKSQFGLRTANVAVRHGVVFGSFDTSPPSLDEWMGDFGWYFDVIYGGVEWEAVGGLAGITGTYVPANWKASAEQNSGDGYHAVTLHRSMVELGMTSPDPVNTGIFDAHDVSTWEGHGLLCRRIRARADKPFFTIEDEAEFPVGWNLLGAMFPGVGVGGQTVPMPMAPDGVFRYAYLFSHVPMSPGTYVASGISLIPKDAPEPLRNATRLNRVSGAVIGPDDMEAWPSMQRAARGPISQEQTIKYNALLGANNPADFPGPGLVHHGISKDDNQWHFWLRYYEMMTEAI
jgi:phenylpropionate dioxygenase-like ring-hydroxylating dioxygenase large terminal subunit